MHTRFVIPVAALALVLAWEAAAGPAHGDRGHWDTDLDDPDHSYDRARRANERGEILSLADIYTHAAAQFPGRVMEAELELEHGNWVYELVILDTAGRLRKVHLDAHSGAVIDKARREDDH